MSGAKKNKFGLTRYIKASVRRKIREDAGYGCVICGNLFVDYEHIEPEFHCAQSHDPERMTLLCRGCHSRVTDKRTSKDRVWQCKADPATKRIGFASEILEPKDNLSIKLNTLTVSGSEVILRLHGKPLLWFEKGLSHNEPLLLNAIFHDENSKPIAYISRNVFKAIVGNTDIIGTKNRIEIRTETGIISLVLESAGGEVINIKSIKTQYGDACINSNDSGDLTISDSNTHVIYNNSAFVDNEEGITLGGIFAAKFTNATQIKMAIDIQLYNSYKIYSINGEHVGWFINQAIINKSYYLVATVSERSIINPIGEYIGELKKIENTENYEISMEDDEYETGEPIWVTPEDKKSKKIRLNNWNDLSHRLFYKN
ncbi:TPA: HNH endonuclease [Serratia fonticola]